VIKYLGSKRTLVPLLNRIIAQSGATTASDLFTGTTRVARGFKQAGAFVTAVDTASYAQVFAKTFIEIDASAVPAGELTDAVARLNATTGKPGYFTETFCVTSRYFQPANGERVDSIRNLIESDYRDTWLYEPLIASLLLATDKVDSTTGMQMAYLKTWSKRSHNDIKLLVPDLLDGAGLALQTDALAAVKHLPEVQLAYLDPPYNQHRYFANYHIWETLVRWDEPSTYGIANKRLDVRTRDHRSAFNSKPAMPLALRELVAEVKAETVVLSYNNESWLSRDELLDICSVKGHVEIIDVDTKRYVGSQIGVYNKAGERVGEPGAKRNTEHVVIAGEKTMVQRLMQALPQG
jgi:adenine-specific DNA-methyltransferase